MKTESDAEFRVRMARFELGKARRLKAEGRADRAAVALARAKLWLWDPGLNPSEKGGRAAEAAT